MSRRISFKSEIKDPDLALKALDSLDMSYRHTGDTIQIMSGTLQGCTVNLKTGEVIGDSDYHTGKLGALRQAYSEQDFRRAAARSGNTIESRTVNAKGEIKILCRMTG